MEERQCQRLNRRLATGRKLHHAESVVLSEIPDNYGLPLRPGGSLLGHLCRWRPRKPPGSRRRHLETRQDSATSDDDHVRRIAGGVGPWPALLGDAVNNNLFILFVLLSESYTRYIRI